MLIDCKIQIFPLQRQNQTFNLYICIVFVLNFSRFLSKVSGRSCLTEGTNLHRDDAARLVVIWLGRVIAIQWIKLWVGFIVEVVNPDRGEVKMEAIHQEQNFDLCPISLRAHCR